MNIPAVGWPGALSRVATLPEGGSSNGSRGWPSPHRGNGASTWRGWARGASRTPTAATRILSTAECWWDAGNYEDGSAVWRNLGTAGAAADLQRYTSSISVLSAVPHRWFKPEGEAYLALYGRTAQGVTCTAPATAVSYAAYQLPSFATAVTTGAVTGGAAFSFSTAGRWTRIDLLDAGSNLVGQWTAAATDPTGMTDVFGVAWTIAYYDGSYSTPVLMRTADDGGLPCFAMGLNAQSNTAPKWGTYSSGNLFDVTSGQDATMLLVVKHNAGNGIYGDYMAYGLRPAPTADTTVARWALQVGFNSTTGYTGITGAVNGSVPTVVYNWSSSGNINKRLAFAFTTTRQGRVINQFVNGSLFNTQQFSASGIGISGGGHFSIGSSMVNASQVGITAELFAAAFFRRSLTAQDLTEISNYYKVGL